MMCSFFSISPFIAIFEMPFLNDTYFSWWWLLVFIENLELSVDIAQLKLCRWEEKKKRWRSKWFALWFLSKSTEIIIMCNSLCRLLLNIFNSIDAELDDGVCVRARPSEDYDTNPFRPILFSNNLLWFDYSNGRPIHMVFDGKMLSHFCHNGHYLLC